MISRLIIASIFTLTSCNSKETKYYQNFLKYLNEEHNVIIDDSSDYLFILLDIQQCEDCLSSLVELLKTSNIKCANIFLAGSNSIQERELKQKLIPSNLIYYDKSKMYLRYEVGFFLAGIVHIERGKMRLYMDYTASKYWQLGSYVKQLNLCKD